MKLPSFQFYPGDWLRDSVSGCSIAAQGLWLRMIITMHDSDRYGYLAVNGLPMSDDFVARKCNVTIAEYQSLLHELEQYSVFSRTSDGTIYSRKMVRNQADRKKNAKRQKDFREEKRNADVTPDVTPMSQGSSSSVSFSKTKDKDTATDVASGPSPSATLVLEDGVSSRGKSNRMQRPTLEELTAYLQERHSSVEAEAFLAFYESNGWKVGKNPMKSWRSAVITWERRQQPDRRTGEVQHWSEIQLPQKTN